MMNPDNGFEPPVNPIPPVVILLTLVIVIVEGAMSLAEAGVVGGARGIGWRMAALQDYGFSPAVLDWMIARGDFSLDLLKRFVTYPFIHGSFTQALFAAALLLALGKFVGDVFRTIPTLIIFFGSTICGALVFGVFAGSTSLLFSAFTPIYGMIGAYTYVIWLRLGHSGQNQMKAFQLIGFLLGIQLVFGLIFGGGQMWIAEITGFASGFVLSLVCVPGGWAALLTKLRTR